MHVSYNWRPENGVKSWLKLEYCELSLQCCKSQQGPVDEKPLLLGAEPSTQPHVHDINSSINSSKVGIVDPKFIFTPALMIQKKIGWLHQTLI